MKKLCLLGLVVSLATHSVFAETKLLVVSTNRRSVRKDVDAPAGLMPTSEVPTFAYDDQKAADTRDENLAKFDELFSQ